MPLPIAHGLLGASLVAAIHPNPEKRRFLPVLAGALLANAADFDFGFSVFFGLKGWHRGFTHSLLFALVFLLAAVIVFGREHFRAALAYGAAYASHFILDFATTQKGHGIELLFPFTFERFGLRLLSLSEIPSQLSAAGIAATIGLEILIFAPLFALVVWVRKLTEKPKPTT